MITSTNDVLQVRATALSSPTFYAASEYYSCYGF